MSVGFNVASWSLWLENDDELDLPRSEHIVVGLDNKLSAVPALLRRRLNSYGKSCAASLLQHATSDNCALVYSSRHGDIARTTDVLTTAANDEAVSPLHFSLAVHNAILGVVSIHTGNRSAASTLSYDNEGLLPLLFEAVGLLQSGYQRVACIMADMPLPEIYRPFKAPREPSFALGFAIEHRATQCLSIELDSDIGSGPLTRNSPFAEAIEFCSILGGHKPAIGLTQNGSLWTIRKQV